MPMPWPETAITEPVEVHEHRPATIEVQDHIIIGTEHRLPLEATEAIMAVILAEATAALEAALEVPALADHREVHVPLEEPHVLLAVVEADAVAEDHNHSINLSINLNHKK